MQAAFFLLLKQSTNSGCSPDVYELVNSLDDSSADVVICDKKEDVTTHFFFENLLKTCMFDRCNIT